jgi:hypothetical protein
LGSKFFLVFHMTWRELARQRYRGALEAETLLERQSPGALALAERTRVRITVAAS